MNLAVQSPILDPVAAYRERFAVSLPCRAEVVHAVSMLPPVTPRPLSSFGWRQTKQSVRAFEGPKWFLSVSPGIVAVRRKFSAERVHFGHTDGVDETETEGPKRGRITGWSEASRNRMNTTLNSLDYAPMFEGERRAAMVTLTLPGQGWEQLVPDLASFKMLVSRFRDAYRYAWGEPLRGTWKMEFQRRGAPHLHILMCPPTGRSQGRGVTKDKSFSSWLGIRWSQIVGVTGGALFDHVMRGTHVDYQEVVGYSDPRRIGAYFAKHGSFSAKDYQNDPPEHWVRAIERGESGGARFWGYWGLEKAIVEAELRDRRAGAMRRASFVDGEPVMHRHRRPSPAALSGEFGDFAGSGIMSECDAETGVLDCPDQERCRVHWDRPPADVVVAMRHLQKLARARSFVRQVEVERWSVDDRTGEVKVRSRKVRRRKVYLKGRSHGYLAVNDGPSTARDIARLLGEPPLRRADCELVA